MYSKYTGVILKKHPLGEADELLTVFTRERGKMRFKSRSTRKIKSRLAGALQTLNEIEFEIAGRGNLPLVISVRISKLNNYLREDLRKFAIAQVGAETLYRISPDGVTNGDAYEALQSFLDEKTGLRDFQLKLLQTHGYENTKLTADKEQEIDRFLEYVLERQIRSTDFMKFIET